MGPYLLIALFSLLSVGLLVPMTPGGVVNLRRLPWNDAHGVRDKIAGKQQEGRRVSQTKCDKVLPLPSEKSREENTVKFASLLVVFWLRVECGTIMVQF